MLGEYVSLVDESLVMLRRSHDSKDPCVCEPPEVYFTATSLCSKIWAGPSVGVAVFVLEACYVRYTCAKHAMNGSTALLGPR